MKVAFEIDARLVLVGAAAGAVGMFALHAAYPSLYNFWPATSQDLAAWSQVVGSVGAIAGAVWIASRQSREKKADDLLRAQLTAAGISIQLSRFASELHQFSLLNGFSDLEAEEPEVDEFNSIQLWLSRPRYRPEQSEFLAIIPLPNKAAHRLARGYELLQVLKVRTQSRGALEQLFTRASRATRRVILNRLSDEIGVASDMITVAARECELASQIGAPYPSTEEIYGELSP